MLQRQMEVCAVNIHERSSVTVPCFGTSHGEHVYIVQSMHLGPLEKPHTLGASRSTGRPVACPESCRLVFCYSSAQASVERYLYHVKY